MPRNVAGVYTLPPVINPVVTATTIASSWANPTLSDIATALSDSIDRQGRTTILANLPMSGFKHTGAAIAANANEYVTWNQTGAKFPALGIGTTSSAWSGSLASAIDLGAGGAIAGDTIATRILGNSYYDGANWRAKSTNTGCIYVASGTLGHYFYTMASVTAGSIQTPVERARIGSDGVRIGVADPGTMYTLSVVGSGAFGSTTGAVLALANTATGRSATLQCDDSQDLTIHNADNNSTGAIRLKTSTGTGAERVRIGNSGVIFTLLASPPTLPANSEMVFNLTTNTNLRISVRGTDGITRVNNLTLA